MKVTKVQGENNKHEVFMYAISTCGWCKRAKKLLNDNNIAYAYVDVDLCSTEDREKIRSTIVKRGGRLVYPNIIIDDAIVISGFHEDKMKEALEI